MYWMGDCGEMSPIIHLILYLVEMGLPDCADSFSSTVYIL